MKRFVMFASFALAFACTSQEKKIESENNNEIVPEDETTLLEEANFGNQNYAVVWEWIAAEKAAVDEEHQNFSGEMMDLWKTGVLEDVYYNSDPTQDKFENYPNISCFIKAENPAEATRILDDLILVEKELATYTLYPVGTKWLGREKDTIIANGLTNSYVAVWSSEQPLDSQSDLLSAQYDSLLALNGRGVIENIYWDFEDGSEILETAENANSITDFVFFVNAASQEEAAEICNSLPFVTENIASYNLQKVGVFWLGKYEEDTEK